MVVLRLEHVDLGGKSAVIKARLGWLHALNRTAEHRLDRVSDQGTGDGNNLLDVHAIFVDPTLNVIAEFVGTFYHNGSSGLFVKREHRRARELYHVPAKSARNLARKHVRVKQLAGGRTRDRSI